MPSRASETAPRSGLDATRSRPGRGAYLRRILAVYLFPGQGPLAFWYETPEVNSTAFESAGRAYYMTFAGKARYPGPFDDQGTPLLDYRGDIGRQYNPIAVAQYGLARYNAHVAVRDPAGRARFLAAADWLVANLEPNVRGLPVWHHRFDWPYRQRLVAPWYSGLAQGQGLSVLVRAARETGERTYGVAAMEAFRVFGAGVGDGGVMARDSAGSPWIEEYIVDPPSHILNGFIWGLWGVHDLAEWSGSPAVRDTFDACVDTLAANLARYDTGAWSLYELNGDTPMLASPYYHRLHIVQLRVLHRLTGREIFARFADRWQGYADSLSLRMRAFAQKAWFKLRHY